MSTFLALAVALMLSGSVALGASHMGSGSTQAHDNSVTASESAHAGVTADANVRAEGSAQRESRTNENGTVHGLLHASTRADVHSSSRVNGTIDHSENGNDEDDSASANGNGNASGNASARADAKVSGSGALNLNI